MLLISSRLLSSSASLSPSPSLSRPSLPKASCLPPSSDASAVAVVSFREQITFLSIFSEECSIWVPDWDRQRISRRGRRGSSVASQLSQSNAGTPGGSFGSLLLSFKSLRLLPSLSRSLSPQFSVACSQFELRRPTWRQVPPGDCIRSMILPTTVQTHAWRLKVCSAATLESTSAPALVLLFTLCMRTRSRHQQHTHLLLHLLLCVRSVHCFPCESRERIECLTQDLQPHTHTHT